MKQWILPVVMISGCATQEKDDRICLEWKSQVEIKERCIPMYGNIVCADEERVRHWCVLYDEPIGKPDDNDA